ncbi:hypothetical protein Hanom_Chr02g00112791 [Helianthus anomalus]
MLFPQAQRILNNIQTNLELEKMVSKVEQAKETQQPKGKNHHHRQPAIQKEMIMQYNKGNVVKFKRSTSHLEDDGVSSAILLLACIACSP